MSAAIPYIRDDTINGLLRLCIKTPYYRLRPALQEAYPRSDCRRIRGSKSEEELRRAAERRALRVIVENENGMIGDPGIFIPRQYRQHAEDELRAEEVFEIAMSRLGTDDRDAFFMRVVELIAKTWLTREDRQAVEQLLSEQRYGPPQSERGADTRRRESWALGHWSLALEPAIARRHLRYRGERRFPVSFRSRPTRPKPTQLRGRGAHCAPKLIPIPTLQEPK